MASDKRPLGPVELAEALGCCRNTVDRAIKDGTIPALRVGRRYFIPRPVVDEMLTNGRIPDPAEQTPKSDPKELAVASAG